MGNGDPTRRGGVPPFPITLKSGINAMLNLTKYHPINNPNGTVPVHVPEPIHVPSGPVPSITPSDPSKPHYAAGSGPVDAITPCPPRFVLPCRNMRNDTRRAVRAAQRHYREMLADQSGYAGWVPVIWFTVAGICAILSTAI